MAKHKGHEGKMGRPTSRSDGGLYSMKGPKNAVPQMARSFDPDLSARQAGILGVMEQQGGQFVASPYGGSFAVGNDDEDVWGGITGTQVGETYGVGGLGLVGTGKALPNPAIPTRVDARSTFSIDVDTASYGLARQALLHRGRLPRPQQIRAEEMINYFDYDYPEPTGAVPFSVTTEVGPCPWNPERRLLHVGLQGKTVDASEVPPATWCS